MRTINQAGLDLIKHFEGQRLTVYADPVGLPTVGVGHLLTAHERGCWAIGTKLTQETVDTLFKHDLLKFEMAVTSLVKVKITDNQFAALVSFAFNLGAGSLKKSTLLRKLNAGDTKGAAEQFTRWNKAGGRVLLGLTRRRQAEKELFLK